VEAGFLSCLETLLFLSFPSSGSIRSGLFPRAFCSLSSFLSSNLAFALSSLGFLLLYFFFVNKLSGSRASRLLKCPVLSVSLVAGTHHSSSLGVGGGVAVHRSGSAGIERQRAGEDLAGKIPTYKPLRSSRHRVKDANLKISRSRYPFVSGLSALRELLDKTMSKTMMLETKKIKHQSARIIWQESQVRLAQRAVSALAGYHSEGETDRDNLKPEYNRTRNLRDSKDTSVKREGED